MRAKREIRALREELRALREQLNNLQGVVECGIGVGHVISVSDNSADWYAEEGEYTFRCISCKFTYTRRKSYLSEKEKALVDLVYGMKN